MQLHPIPMENLETWYREELCEAFPPCERKPLPDIRALMDAGRYQLLGLYEGEALLGYATLWSHPEYPGYVMLDYLGVNGAHRSRGLGGQILGLLAERCRGTTCLVLEAEAPDSGGPEEERPLRERRLAFYVRNGCTPVYETFACGLRCRAFVLGEVPEDLERLKAAHRAIYGPMRTDVVIDAPPDAAPSIPYWMQCHPDEG